EALGVWCNAVFHSVFCGENGVWGRFAIPSRRSRVAQDYATGCAVSTDLECGAFGVRRLVAAFGIFGRHHVQKPKAASSRRTPKRVCYNTAMPELTRTFTFLGTGTSVGVPMVGCDCDVCRSTNPRNHRYRCAVLIGTQNGNILIDTPPE